MRRSRFHEVLASLVSTTSSRNRGAVIAGVLAQDAAQTPHSHSIVARQSKCLTSLIISHFIMAIYRQIDRRSTPLTEGGRR